MPDFTAPLYPMVDFQLIGYTVFHDHVGGLNGHLNPSLSRKQMIFFKFQGR